MRSDFDSDIFHLGYRWKRSDGNTVKRLAFTIHIDDIEGMFGEAVYLMAKDMPAGGWEWMPQ